MTNELKARIHRLDYEISKCYPQREPMFCSLCGTILKIYDGEKYLTIFLDAADLCMKNQIDPLAVFELGIKLGDIVQKGLSRDSEHGKEQAKCPRFARITDDYKFEYSLIYQKSLCLNCSVDDLLRDYYLRIHEMNFDEKRYQAMRRQYYRFISKFYPRNIVGGIKSQINGPTLKLIAGYPSFGQLIELQDLSRNIRKEHIFYIISKGNIATLIYEKSKRQYLLCAGSIIKKELKKSAKIYQCTLKKWIESGVVKEIHGDSEHYQLLKTTIVSSSSHAASLVKGVNVSGTKIWITANGKTLREVLKAERNQEDISRIRRNKNRKYKRKKAQERSTSSEQQ